MEKLLRILFIISAIAFVTTIAACINKNKNNDNDTVTKTTKTPSILKFTAAPNGVTIDTTKDVYKITINPSLLTYDYTAVDAGALGKTAAAPAPIFTVTFTDDKQRGFIIPTTAASADAFTTTHVANPSALSPAIAAAQTPSSLVAAFIAARFSDNQTFSFLRILPRGFYTSEINDAWSALGPRVADAGHGVEHILTDTKVRVACKTTITGINEDSFAKADPDAANDLAIGDDTETACLFSLVGEGTDPVKTAAYKAWATKAVEAGDADSTKNIQKMGFVGIVTGDDKASAITKAAGKLLNANITAATSAKLVKEYNGVLQKVEIVIAEAK